MDRVVQILINAAALWVAVMITPIDFVFAGDGWWKFLVVAVIFSVVNTYLRPILRILTLPISVLTLGLFLIVINALMLLLTGAVSAELNLGLSVPDFWAAILAAIVISIVSLLLSLFVGTSRLAGKAL
jgi:putative membrane protein